MITQDNLDDLAKEYNQTKDPELKKLWHKKVKEWANGFDTFKQRPIVSVSKCHKGDDGGYIITGRRRLF